MRTIIVEFSGLPEYTSEREQTHAHSNLCKRLESRCLCIKAYNRTSDQCHLPDQHIPPGPSNFGGADDCQAGMSVTPRIERRVVAAEACVTLATDHVYEQLLSACTERCV